MSVVGRGGGQAVSRTQYEKLRLVEVSPAGVERQTLWLPRSVAADGLAVPQSPNQRMGMSLPGELPTRNKGAYSPQSAVIGLLSRSGLGEWISWAGTSGPVGTAWDNNFMPWTFAMVNYNGTVNTMTCACARVSVRCVPAWRACAYAERMPLRPRNAFFTCAYLPAHPPPHKIACPSQQSSFPRALRGRLLQCSSNA